MKRKLLVVLSFVAMLFLFAACSNDDDANEKDDGKDDGDQVEKTDSDIVNLVMWSSPGNLNPYFREGNYGQYASGILVLDTLLKYDPDYQMISALAEDYDISSDGLEYTFFLREGVKWHDGEAFTANDIAFTFKSVMDPDFSGIGFSDLRIIEGAQEFKDGQADDVAGIQVVNDYEIKFTLESPYAPFLEAVGTGLYILPEHAFEGVAVADMAQADFSDHPIGTGPAKFVRYQTDQYIEYDMNEDYYLGAPKFDKLILRIMSPDVALAAFESGEIDATTRAGLGTINISDFEQVSQVEKLEVNVFDTMAYQVVTVNTEQPHLKDNKVRQAIAYAIDRQAIVNQLLQGMGLVANGPIHQNSPWYYEDITTYSYDPDRARELLEEAGWDFNQTIRLAVPTGNILRERTAPIIQHYLQEVGFKVQLESMDFATLMSNFEVEDGYDLALIGMSTGMIDPDSNITTFFHSEHHRPAGWNSANYVNPEMDELLDLAAITADENERKALYDQVQAIISEDMPYIYLYYEQAIGATNKRLNNAIPNLVGIEWNIHEWEVAE